VYIVVVFKGDILEILGRYLGDIIGSLTYVMSAVTVLCISLRTSPSGISPSFRLSRAQTSFTLQLKTPCGATADRSAAFLDRMLFIAANGARRAAQRF
jgi:hypothetical protein